MKIIKAFIFLVILAWPIMADEGDGVVVLGDFDKTSQGFGFSRGELITADTEADSLPSDIDFIVDLPNGLGMNNRALSDWFPGNAMIIDLGDVPLEIPANLPADEFTPFLSPDEIVAGHTYLVQTATTTHYGMIRIVDFDIENSLLIFNWIYANK